MDDSSNSHLLAFDSPLNQSSYIKVVGVGGGGNNAVNHMFRRGITGVDFIVCNTDLKALNGSPVPNKLVLGHSGMGAGNDPAKARRAAEGKEKEIKELFEHNTKMVFITAGMGGGTGTGAAPVIARFAKDIKLQDEDLEEEGKILVVAVVTTPFQFEGKLRLRQAIEGVEELRKHVDSILVINNEKLRGYGNLVITDAFAMANDVLLTAVKGIAEIITLNASVNIDFRDVNTVMENSGTALMGIGEGEGEHRARQAVEQATTSVLLDDNDIAGAKNVLLYFSYGPEHEITMDEMSEITDYLCQKTGSADTNVIWGTGEDGTLGEKVKITLIATGFEQKERPEPNTYKLPEPIEKPVVTPVAPAGEPHIVPQGSRPSGNTPEAPKYPNDRIHDYPTPTSVQSVSVEPVIERVPSSTTVAEPAVQPAKPRVISLYDDESKETERVATPQPADDGMHIINRQDAVQPSSQSVGSVAESVQETRRETVAPALQQPTPQPNFGRLEKEAMSRADRIKMMHDLLRNDVNGAAIVESMNPMELTGERLYQAAHSSESSVHEHGVTASGEVKPNDYLFSVVD